MSRKVPDKAVADAVAFLAPAPSAPVPVATAAAPVFAWSDAVRAALIEVYQDSGSVESALETMGVSASEYFRELERNPEFAAAWEEAKPKALARLRWRATQLALNGNDRLLQAILKAEFPEFRDSVKVDLTAKHEHSVRGLTDEQLHERLERVERRLVGRTPRVFDAAFSAGESGPRRIALASAGAAPADLPEQNSDTVS